MHCQGLEVTVLGHSEIFGNLDDSSCLLMDSVLGIGGLDALVHPTAALFSTPCHLVQSKSQPRTFLGKTVSSPVPPNATPSLKMLA
jgi:hypothetical protein